MIHTHNFNGIKLDIQAAGIEVDTDMEERIKKLFSRLQRFYSHISHADVYIEDKKGKSTNAKSIKIRLGVPGPDVFAEDAGDNFMALLSSVEDKLRSQLGKK
ncbi:MAG: ribosome-associated translation inhibitor RaiA [Bacteroidetes bacterium]|nr:ribosome-associated translation inhibitor RaiA [Bacteroidota bacterium]MBS1540900.1 ribosome-associated translation inhibitor RaiA [Bacteroidota bacterium]